MGPNKYMLPGQARTLWVVDSVLFCEAPRCFGESHQSEDINFLWVSLTSGTRQPGVPGVWQRKLNLSGLCIFLTDLSSHWSNARKVTHHLTWMRLTFRPHGWKRIFWISRQCVALNCCWGRCCACVALATVRVGPQSRLIGRCSGGRAVRSSHLHLWCYCCCETHPPSPIVPASPAAIVWL